MKNKTSILNSDTRFVDNDVKPDSLWLPPDALDTQGMMDSFMSQQARAKEGLFELSDKADMKSIDAEEYDKMHWNFAKYVEEFIKETPETILQLGEVWGWQDFAEKTVGMEKEETNFWGKFWSGVGAIGNTFDPFLENHFRGAYIASKGEEEWLKMIDRNSAKINIEKGSILNNPIAAYTQGWVQSLPYVREFVRFYGEGAVSNEQSLSWYLGNVTGFLTQMLLMRKLMAKTGAYQKIWGKTPSNMPKLSGFSERDLMLWQGKSLPLIQRIFIPLGEKSLSMGKLGRFGINMMRRMFESAPNAMSYGMTTFISKKSDKFRDSENWNTEDFQDIVRSMAIGQGMGMIGNYFGERELLGLWPHLKARVAEEATQMMLGAGITLQQLYQEQGYINLDDLGIAMLYEAIELGPEIGAPALLGLTGKTAGLSEAQKIDMGKRMVRENIRDIVTFRMPWLKGTDKAERVTEDFEAEHIKFRKLYPEAGLREYRNWVKEFTIKRDENLARYVHLVDLVSSAKTSEDLKKAMELKEEAVEEEEFGFSVKELLSSEEIKEAERIKRMSFMDKADEIVFGKRKFEPTEFNIERPLRNAEVDELMRSPQRLAILQQMAHENDGLEKLTKTEVQNKVMWWAETEEGAKKGPLDTDVFNRNVDVENIFDNAWEDVQLANKHKLTFEWEGRENDISIYKEALRRIGIPKDVDDGKMALARETNFKEYRSLKLEDLKKIKNMTDEELNRAHKQLTRRIRGWEVSLETMPKEMLKVLQAEVNRVEAIGEDNPYIAALEREGLLRPEKTNRYEVLASALHDLHVAKPFWFSRYGSDDLIVAAKKAEANMGDLDNKMKDDELICIQPFLRKGMHLLGNEAISAKVSKYLGTPKKFEGDLKEIKRVAIEKVGKEEWNKLDNKSKEKVMNSIEGYSLRRLQADLDRLGKHMTINELKQTTGKYKAWLGSKLKDAYWDPNFKTRGPAREFDVKYGRLVENYFPFFRQIAQAKNVDEMNEIMDESVHGKARKTGFEGFEEPVWDKQILDAAIEKYGKEKWDSWNEAGKQKALDRVAGEIMGTRATQKYLRSMSRARFLGPIIRDFNDRAERLEKEGKLDSQSKAMWNNYVSYLHGSPGEFEKITRTTFTRMTNHFQKAFHVNVPSEAIETGLDNILMLYYSGGLGSPIGGKISTLTKQALQGILLNPPGLTEADYFRGYYLQWRYPSYRADAHNHGIYETLGVAGFNKAMNLLRGNPLRWTFIDFTLLDRYNNRGPWYHGAKYKFKMEFLHNGTDGVERLVRHLPEGTRARIVEDAYRVNQKFDRTSEWDIKQLDDLASMYGFWAQANSNWEYTQHGKPYAWFPFNIPSRSAPGRAVGVFQTWWVNYWGHYLPSLIKRDKVGFLRHIAKMAIAGYFAEKLGVNAWKLLPVSSAPSSILPPLGQSLENVLGYMAARSYGNEEWMQEELDDLKRSARVAFPMGYGTADLVNAIDKMKKQTPYMDSKGFWVTEAPVRETLTDLFGTPRMWDNLEVAAMALEQGFTNISYDEAHKLLDKWNRMYSDEQVKRAMRRQERIPETENIR